MPTAIEFENISKQYRLGLVSTKTLSHDIRRFWITNVLGKEDPYLKIGETNDRSTKGSSEYVWALRDINFKVEQGDVVGIIGKNGAGKSTLLKLLSKVTGPTTGTIRAKGRIGSLLEVGTGFHSEMTGRENIFLNGAILGMTKQEIARKLDEIVDFSGCERYIDTPVKRYSSGMMVRLGFAVAAHLDPEILVVDEVLAVGDAEFQKKAIGKMQDVSRGEGRTVLFVSHNMASVRQLCKHGILLEKGMIKYVGDIDHTIDQYICGNRIKDGLIVDAVKIKNPNVEIDEILVNNSPHNTVAIKPGDTSLDFVVRGSLKKNMKISLEIRFTDSADVPFLFYSPEHADSAMHEQGPFELKGKVILPQGLTKGTFFANIFLTNSMVEGLVDVYKAVSIESEGCATPSGYTFEYANNQGFIYMS